MEQPQYDPVETELLPAGTLERRPSFLSRWYLALRSHPIVLLKRIRRLMASIIAWLVGLLFFGVGAWILILRFEGLVDHFYPHSMSIGRMTVDGADSTAHAELLRARFDHHFRRPPSIPKETGFLEVATLDAPELFQPQSLQADELRKMTLEVSGVNVSTLVRSINQLAQPDQWIVEGDFQSQSDRALLALRLRRGERLIRTWYLEAIGDPQEDKSLLLERLVDDAVFQLVYDFGNEAEQDTDLAKWRRLIPAPTRFPNRTAVSAYYQARSSLGQYYAHGDWADLDRAITCLQALRGQMPEYPDGLQLLGMALAERRMETEAIHVYQQLLLLLRPPGQDFAQLSFQQKRRLLQIELLKASATSKLYTWRSAHDAIRQLLQLHQLLQTEVAATTDAVETAALTELAAQTAVQAAYSYMLYLPYLRDFTVGDVLGHPAAPQDLRVTDPDDLRVLREGPTTDAKRIVHGRVMAAVQQYEGWLAKALAHQQELKPIWKELADGERRKIELAFRLHLTSGIANYRMAEWEEHDADRSETVFGELFLTRLQMAEDALRKADAAHPNHYLALQYLGLIASEPRRGGTALSMAEQYFERAVLAKPSDYYSHELLAKLRLQQIANIGVDLASRDLIEKGIESAQIAVRLRDVSGSSQLLRAKLLALQLEIETDDGRRKELISETRHCRTQAERFLPQAFGRPHPDLTWIRVILSTRRLGESAESVVSPAENQQAIDAAAASRFVQARQELEDLIHQLIEDCRTLEERWVARQRVFKVAKLRQQAEQLLDEVETATLANWRQIVIPFQ